MTETFVRTVTTTGAAVRPGDVISVGGIHHTVDDVRELPRARKRLQFADGNAYVLTRTTSIVVTRHHIPAPRSRDRHS